MQSMPARSSASWDGRREETFDSGLRKTVQWYIDNAADWQRVTSERTRLDRLG